MVDSHLSEVLGRSPGRPASFDTSVALEAAESVFKRQGYSSTSVSELVSATSLSRSSLYATFGSKSKLFWAVLQRAAAESRESLIEPLVRGTDGFDDLFFVLDSLNQRSQQLSGEGIFIINCILDQQAVSAANQFRNELRSAITITLQRAQKQGEISVDHVAPAIDIVLGAILAISMLARAGAKPHEIEAQTTATKASLRALAQAT